jgi:hypothetical protein
MTHGRFDRKLPLPKSGRITIKGPFNPQDAKVDSAKVLFLIVQGEGDDAVIVDGEGMWNRANGNEWSGTTARRGKHAGGKGTGPLHRGLARGIALSVVIKPGKTFDGGRKFDPPTIESLTWCADFEFVEPAADDPSPTLTRDKA